MWLGVQIESVLPRFQRDYRGLVEALFKGTYLCLPHRNRRIPLRTNVSPVEKRTSTSDSPRCATLRAMRCRFDFLLVKGGHSALDGTRHHQETGSSPKQRHQVNQFYWKGPNVRDLSPTPRVLYVRFSSSGVGRNTQEKKNSVPTSCFQPNWGPQTRSPKPLSRSGTLRKRRSLSTVHSDSNKGDRWPRIRI